MCLVCERIAAIRCGENPCFVKELNTGFVVLGDHQRFYGYTLFLYKDHISELYELDWPIRMKFLEEMSLVAQAAAKAFNAEKMNCELLGNSAAHLHWHLFCRHAGDLNGNAASGPVWWVPKEEMYSETYRPKPEELEKMKAQLCVELEELLAERVKEKHAHR